MRHFTKPDTTPTDVFNDVTWSTRSVSIKDPDGTVIFEADNLEFPASWSDTAAVTAAGKYFRKRGVPNDRGCEFSLRQLIIRVVTAIGDASHLRDEELNSFMSELTYILLHQIAAFNSPVWFNVGLALYGIKGHDGNFVYDPDKGESVRCADAYVRPQASACFILKPVDSLDGIFEQLADEMRIFRGGSGAGANFSAIRGKQEILSGGGKSSGLISFLEVFDKAAGAIKSGGTTRRAAKMVILDVDHPEIMDFISWKNREEKKAQALIAAGYPADFNGEAYHTISGQNANNTIRVSDAFMEAVYDDEPWETLLRTTGKVCETLRARDVWDAIAQNAWECADPGVHFGDTINRWHTVPNAGPINASNPCSEFLHHDDTACNLASINLMKFVDGTNFNTGSYAHTVDILIIAMEVLVGLSSYPTAAIAENSYKFRPLGLGYANLGALLMNWGVPYDSDRGRTIAGALAGILTGRAYARSSMLAKELGAFEGFDNNRNAMLRVMEMHRTAAGNLLMSVNDPQLNPLTSFNLQSWDHAVTLGLEHGYRNSQASVMAPTGTIALMMDCATTGIEPDFAMVKLKRLAGRGTMRLVNQEVRLALLNLGYSDDETVAILNYMVGCGSLRNAKHPFANWVANCLLQSRVPLAEVDSRIALSLSYDSVFTKDFVKQHTEMLGELTIEEIIHPPADVRAAVEKELFGAGTVEGAPFIRPEHLAVFDCANRAGTGTRFISPEGHIKMLAAIQPFVSGSMSKTVNLPATSTKEEIKALYELGYHRGCKAIAVYRDGCKASQPLTSTRKEEPIVAPRLTRRRPPDRRLGYTQKANVGGMDIYIHTGNYEDGALAEVFVTIGKEGSTLRGVLDAVCTLASIMIQYGIPLADIADKLIHTRYEPAGVVVGDEHVKLASSMLDYIFRHLSIRYDRRVELAHVLPDDAGGHGDDIVAWPAEAPTNPDRGRKATSPRRSSLEAEDGPVCTTCGHLTRRAGACYLCVTCGTTTGCGLANMDG